MFMGEYENKLDAKGRMIVPSKFRYDLNERFILTRGLDKCLFGYTLEEWQTIEEKMKSLPLTKRDARKFVRMFFSGAIEVEIDKQGRINIPAKLREYAHLDKECTVIGVSNRIEIWDRNTWNDFYDESEESFEEIAEDLIDFDFLKNGGFAVFHHISVLLKETVDQLNIKEDGVYVDCTLGGAGHSQYLLNQLSDEGRLIAIDQDMTAINHAKEKLQQDLHKVTFVHNNFRNLANILAELNIDKVDGILYDLGVSSPQLDVPERGFSYQHNAKLDMRMDQTQPLSAYEVVNTWSYETLVKIFFRYGEEKFSKQIARKIEARRQQQPIETTFDLVACIKEGIPAKARRKGGHPAKRVFQAIRIAVNDELAAFEDSLEQAIDHVKVNGRISVITFHSLEDRLCKQMFQEYEKGPDVPRGLPVLPEAYTPKLKRVNRKPIVADATDLEDNHRARSAKLRVAEILK